MEKDNICYKTYVEILERELVPAMGCTEPIALAYCSAKARSVLGVLPDKVLVEVSGNIVKNVKSVIVPNSGGAGELRRQRRRHPGRKRRFGTGSAVKGYGRGYSGPRRLYGES